MIAADSGSPVGRSAGYDSTTVGDGDGLGDTLGIDDGVGVGDGDGVTAVGLGDGDGSSAGEHPTSNTRHETTATTRMTTPFPGNGAILPTGTSKEMTPLADCGQRSTAAPAGRPRRGA